MYLFDSQDYILLGRDRNRQQIGYVATDLYFVKQIGENQVTNLR